MNFNKNIPEIEKKIGYTFKDKSLLRQAFTRSSYCNEHKVREKYISNEVLEFFGDSVLSTAIVSLMTKEKTRRYEHGIYTELDEGDFSNIRSKLSDKRNLSLSMQRLGLQRHLLMGEGDSKLGVENEPSVMEDLFESIIGAIYIDCGMDMSMVIKVVSGMLDVSVYFSGRAEVIQSYKNALQEWCADKKHRLPQPVYKTIKEEGPDHKKIYERGVYIGDRLIATGKGKNQKLADASAAEEALKLLRSEMQEQTNRNQKQTIVDKNLRNPLNGNGKLKAQSLMYEKTKQQNKEQERPRQVEKALPRQNATTSSQALKRYALKIGAVNPLFRDLGESVSNGGKTEYRVECLFGGISAIGVGSARPEARESASAMILKELEKTNNKSRKKTAKK